jgi:hypothetical protein
MNYESIEEHLDVGNLLGCIRHNDLYQYYMLDIADWILNYGKYDPESVDDVEFRNGLINISDQNIDAYVEYIKDGEVEIAAVSTFLTKNGSDNLFPYFYIDFDNFTFVNTFPNISVEDYLPGDNWVGIYESPIPYLPEEMKIIWPVS